MKYQEHGWFWRLLLVVILLAGVGQMWYAVNKVEYQWGWQNIPRYFFYKADTAVKAPFDSTVTAITAEGDSATVFLTSENGEKVSLTVDAKDLRVKADEELFDADTVGYLHQWKTGQLMKGLWVTIWISAVSSVFALIIGMVAGLCRLSSNFTLRGLAGIYIEIIRGTPLLVQIYIAYFLIGTVYNLNREVCGIGALSLFAGAYVAEIIRAGIQAIPKGQAEAARSLGMNSFQTMKDVVLPQAFKKILPPLAGQFISLIKDSSLVSIISIIDLTKAGRDIASSTFATFEIWISVAAMYFIVTTLLSQLVYYMERRFRVSD